MSIVKKKFPIFITIIVAIAAVIAGGGFLYHMLQNNIDEVPDSSISKIEDDKDEAGSVDVSLRYAGYATLDTEKNLVTLNFVNPKKSKKTFNLEIVADINGENLVLAITDKIRPGYKIDSVKSALDREVPKGDYKGKFIVHFYNEQGKEEVVNSEIAISIHVR